MKIIVAGYSILDSELSPRSVMTALDALGRRGHEVTWIVATVNKRPKPEGRIILHDITLRKNVRLLSFLHYALLATIKIVRSIGKFQALVVDDYVSLCFFLPLLMIFRVTAHGSIVICLRVQTNPLRGTLHTFAYALSVKSAAAILDRVFFITPMLRDRAVKELRIAQSKTGVWPSSVDLSIFRPSVISKPKKLRDRMGLRDDFVVLYHGVIGKRRGVLELVRAFEILKRRSTTNVALVLLGDGNAASEIKTYVRLRKLGDVIKIVGPVPLQEVPEYIQACDVGISPLPDNSTWRYQCPIKVLEVLAMNKPLLVSDIACHRWMLGNSRMAYFLPGTSSKHIARGVEDFIAIKKSSDYQGRRIASKFSTERIAENVEGELLSVLFQSNMRRCDLNLRIN